MNALLDWFGDSGIANLATFAVAVGAVLASLWATAVSRRANARSHNIQAHLLRIEEQRESDRAAQSARAVLRASLTEAEPGNWRLYIKNEGSGEARHLEITMDGTPLANHRAVGKGKQIGSVIGPGAENHCPLSLSRGCRPPFDLHLNWQDDSGQPGRWRTTLTL